MRAFHSFTVRPRVPVSLAPLDELARNLRWSWNRLARDLFRSVDPEVWERTGHDPIALLSTVGRRRLEALATDDDFMAAMAAAHDDLRRHLGDDLWFQSSGHQLSSVAYFSPEFGIAEALPQYSGGLGVLAGDHLKAASGLGVPVVAVGLLYREGYFRQGLAADGWQEERYVTLDPEAMALTLCEGVRVEIEQADGPLVARVWKASVGRVPLYLLDTDVEENDADSRSVTDRLYGGDIEHRLRQEILLGVGGVRALDGVGARPEVFHTNEGHAGFLGLERIRRHIVSDRMTFDEAVEAVRTGTVFTTHTPVPAGIDRFARPLMERYFRSWADECGVPFDTVMALGQEPGEPPDAPFNMAVMGLRLASYANGVSRLHARVSRRIFAGLWPSIPEEELPIDSVTNGVHALSWVSPEMDALLVAHVQPRWQEGSPESWAGAKDIPDAALWAARQEGRRRLVEFARARVYASMQSRRVPEAELGWCADCLDPDILTIGFARRFAAYKRATLLLSQAERLVNLLLDAERPIQLLFAGKAHPADDVGKDMIRQVVQFSRQSRVRHRIVFLEDYDIAVARAMYQGCDLWLNTPRRPLEACGTSGEKAALNGALNCSVRDGWWDEFYDGTNGWAIASAEEYDDLWQRDHAEAASLFELLERQVIPLFYDRGPDGLPSQWLDRVRSSLHTLGPFVAASRMVRDYVTDMYAPAAARGRALGADGAARARALAAWKARVRAGWGAVRVENVEADGQPADVGGTRSVRARVSLGDLSPADVEVQLIHGPVSPTDELADTAVAPMVPEGVEEDGRARYSGSFTCEQAGRYGYTVRVVPTHPDLRSFAEVGRIAWA
ncbi:MAG TPA: alpha-glucan family phosphorylase [Acidimicrobiales bacterium]|nr:alpha-glucan family phosphorylase [Acidimicrobiales bacterium]